MFMRHRLAVAARFSSIPWITLRQESKQNTTCRRTNRHHEVKTCSCVRELDRECNREPRPRDVRRVSVPIDCAQVGARGAAPLAVPLVGSLGRRGGALERALDDVWRAVGRERGGVPAERLQQRRERHHAEKRAALIHVADGGAHGADGGLSIAAGSEDEVGAPASSGVWRHGRRHMGVRGP